MKQVGPKKLLVFVVILSKIQLSECLVGAFTASHSSFCSSSLPTITQSPYFKRKAFRAYHGDSIVQSLSSQISDEKENDNDTSENLADLPLKTYDDFREKFQAIAFLQSMQGEGTKGSNNGSSSSSFEEDFCQEAQALFDKMFEEWYMNEKDDLEPTTEIYNLLIEIYSNSKHAKDSMKIPEQILNKMEHGDGDNVPSPNTETYVTIMKGWAKKSEMEKVEQSFQRLENRYEQTSDPEVFPTIDAYNSLLSSWLKSEIKYAPSKAENILFKIMERERISQPENNENSDMIPSYIGPDTKTFYLVMSCFIRDKFLSQSSKISKVQDIMQLMKEWEIQHIDATSTVDSKHKNISNIRIKTSKNAIEAESILFDMIEEYQVESDENHRPDAASFINTMNAWRDSRSREAPQRSLELLDLLTEIYEIECASGRKVYDLKPDKRVYNAVQNVWCRSRSEIKAHETKALLMKLMSLYEENDGDDDYLPSVRQWNNVLNACVYTRGDQGVRKEAMKIMVETFNELRNNSLVDANHATYGLFLKGCGSLLPSGEKQQTIVENVFRKCCREGLVSEFVFNALVESSSPDLCQKLFGGDVHDKDGVRIPQEWARKI